MNDFATTTSEEPLFRKLNEMPQVTSTTVVLYRKGSYESFVAAFVHWAIYGNKNVTYKAVDVFDDVRDHGILGHHVVTFGLCKREIGRAHV